MEKTNLPEAAVSALTNGQKIQAIKIVRQEYGLGLKEAHEQVNQYIQGNTAIQEKLRTGGHGGLLHFIAFIIIVVVILYFL